MFWEDRGEKQKDSELLTIVELPKEPGWITSELCSVKYRNALLPYLILRYHIIENQTPHWCDGILNYNKLKSCNIPSSRLQYMREMVAKKVVFACFLNYGSEEEEVKLLSCVWLFVTPWTVAHQAPPSMGFSRQEYWSGLPFPFLGDLPDPGIESRSPTLQADALTSEPPGKPKLWRQRTNK